MLDKVVIGVRKAEGRKRKEIYNEPTMCRYFGAKKKENHVEQIYPILEWTDKDVRDFILDRGLKLAPLYYDTGGKSTLHEDSVVCAVRWLPDASALSSFRSIRA
ncbi:phosphoadenosine phosphosulfate reductase domain-containing protein [Prevotella sp.]|uniref:phosphoadenosine phosphosulfate reductase domain-containing protein n=1 Tax=Prevotella sp. TaxID=59823 RepID=UPI003AF55AF4